MILAVRKSDNAVFEHFACDGLLPICYLRDLKGNEFRACEKDYKLVFERDAKYSEYLELRV